jgi:tetratricopeptide (TPR) repeat protein
MMVGLAVMITSVSVLTDSLDLTTDWPLVLLVGGVWILGSALAVLRSIRLSEKSESKPNWGTSLVFALAFSLLPALAGVPLHMAGLPPAKDPSAMVPIDYILLGASVVVLAVTTRIRDTRPPRPGSSSLSWLYAALLIAVVVVIGLTNLNVARANVWFRASQSLARAEQWNAAVRFGTRATELAPHEAHYHLFLGRTYTSRALTDRAHTERWLERAEKSLLEATAINPLDPEHYAHLGQVYQYEARALEDDQLAAEALTKALENYDVAAARSPEVQAPLLRQQRLAAHEALARLYARMGEVDRAAEEVRAARQLAQDEDEQDRLDRLLEGLEAGDR